MRWGSQQITDDRQGQLALFGRDEVVTRTFETPEFQGMTFYEVQAKSIINKVPSSSQMPNRRNFVEWTINPYRGCSHACVYCLAADTPVLLASGSEKPIGQLTRGDAIVGTVPGASQRHYVITHVVAKWETDKPAYRLTFSDGRTITASADHRFLTETGWSYVTADGDDERPHLTPGQLLVSSGIRARTMPYEIVGHQIPLDARVELTSIEETGETLRMVDITTGTGDFIAAGVVSHNCFARNTHTYLDLDAGADFDSKVVVKINAPELLRRELRKHNGAHIAMGTNVDCYQRAEGRYKLMPGIIQELTRARNPFSILTKGTLLLRDLELLKEAAAVTEVSLLYSIGLTDKATWRTVEPGTPSPAARLQAVRTLTDNGFEVGVLMAPILPYITDSPRQLEETVRAIAESGAVGVTPIVLHLRPGAREWWTAWLARHHPELVGRYRELYAGGSYVRRDLQQDISGRVAHLARKYRLRGRERSMT